MYGYYSVIVTVSVLVLVSLVDIVIAATTATPLSIKSSTSSEVRSTYAVNNTIKNGNTEKQCQCVVFHSCDQNNVINVTTADNQDRCDGDNVCCRIYSSSSSSLQTDPPLRTSYGWNNKHCVPFWECLNYEPITEAPSEEGLLYIRGPSCDAPNLWCPTSNLRQRRNIDEQECGIKGNSSSDNELQFLLSMGPGRDTIRTDENRAETSFGEFPWMVALFRTNESSANVELICTASLLSPYWVLTAAHCVNNVNMTLLRVRAGEHIIGNENETIPHQDRTVNIIKIHPNYNPKRLYNDMALLRVNEPFHYDSHINGICLPLVGSDFVGPNSYRPTSCWVAGWGKANIADKNIQLKLKKVELPIVNRDECQSKLRTTKLGAKFTLDSSFLCAGGEKGFDSCRGDGGGPLFCATRSNENKFIQVGIFSWGFGCVAEIPSIYASLEANSEWLTTEINTMTGLKP